MRRTPASPDRTTPAAVPAIPWSLIASLAPGGLFIVGLLLLEQRGATGWRHGGVLPWELLVIGLCGTAATIAGVADWRYHRREGIRVGPKEHQAELLALAGGGVPLFVLMCAATGATALRRHLMIPIIVVALVTVVGICYDEFVFHRKRCGRYETVLHRVLVLGHAAAWLAWMHWCFVRGGTV